MSNLSKKYLLLLLALVSTTARGGYTILECGQLLETAEARWRTGQSVLINGDRVEAVGNASEITETMGNAPLDARYALPFCLPGLMDMHVHLKHQNSVDHYIKRFIRNEADTALRAAHYARITLLAGFTTVRDMGDNSYETIALRNAIQEDIAAGPRIYAVGKSIATTGGHADPTNGYRRDLMGDPGPARGVIDGPDEAREAVRYRYKLGADAIKITATGGVLSLAKSGRNPQFNREELDAIVRTADDYGMHVAAHAHGLEGVRRAVLAGVRSIEHGTYLDREVMQLMKERGTFLVPTILAGVFVDEKAQVDGYFPEVIRPKAAEIGPVIKETFRRAHEAGVPIAFGTDCGVAPHGDNARELVLMVENGMTPMQAIKSATVSAAELLGESHQLGQVAPGYYADIIAVYEDPLTDISRLQEVSFVMKGGTVVKSDFR